MSTRVHTVCVAVLFIYPFNKFVLFSFQTDVIKPPSVKSSDSKEAIRKDRSSSKHSESDHSLKHKVDDDSRTYHDVRKNGDTKSSKGQKSGLCVVS